MTAVSPLRFASFGVGVAVEASETGHLEWMAARLPDLMAGYVAPLGDLAVQHVFRIETRQDGTVVLFHGDERLGETASAQVALQYLCACIKGAVGESTSECVLVHAGVVGVGGRAVVLPAHSNQGKTTLVRALIERGAVYYSDDLAVIDHDGLVHPFAKTLSLRGFTDDYTQVETTVESLGGVAGQQPLPVGLVLFTRFAPDMRWAPLPLTAGQATLRLLEHTLNGRRHTALTLGILGKMVTSGTVLWESERGDAAEVADAILRRLG